MYDKEFVLTFFENIGKKLSKIRIKPREIKINVVSEKAVALIGPRRAGKTYFLLMHYAKDKQGMYIDFEHSAFRDITHRDVFEIISFFESIYKRKVSNLYLDEIQVINEWERLIRSLLDSGYNVMMTGSSSKLLSKEIATQLRGRTLSYVILPLSFREYLRFRGKPFINRLSLNEKVRLLNELEEYMSYGGYPEVVIKEEDKERILREYITTILYKDFVERFDLSQPLVARYIFEFCLQSYSKEVSVNKIVNHLQSKLQKRMKEGVYEYVMLLEETFAIFFLSRFTNKIKERLFWPKKVYVCDIGLSAVVSLSKDTGKKMENIFFLELKRRENDNPLQEIYYYKTKEGYEVDFLIKEGTRIKELVQVSYANSYEEVQEREIRALLHAKEDLKLGDGVHLTIITWDYEDEREVEWWRKKGKIRFVPLWKWLLKV